MVPFLGAERLKCGSYGLAPDPLTTVCPASCLKAAGIRPFPVPLREKT